MPYGPYQIMDISSITTVQLFIECALYARRASFHLARTERYYCNHHFTQKEDKAQRSEVTYPESPSQEVMKPWT